MSLIDNIRGKGGTAAPAQSPGFQAPGIAKRLETAKAELTDLERQHGEAALADVLGEAGAGDRLSTLNRQIASARANLETLTAAHAAAVSRDDAARRAYRAQLQKTQLNALKQHVGARDRAGERLSAAIAEAAAAFRELIDRSEKAAHTAEAARFDFDGALCSADELVKLVRYELTRASNAPGANNDLGGKLLPGSIYDPNWSGRPTEIPPLPDKLKAASAAVLAQITGKTE